MIQNAALDVAIALALMYLMLSLLCTIINEYVASKLGLRAASLAAGLQEILDDPSVRKNFYVHGLIAGSKNAVANSDNMLGSLVKKFGNLRAAVVDAKKTTTLAKAAEAAETAGPVARAGADAGASATQVRSADTPAPAPPPGNHPSYISSTNFTMALLGSLDTSKQIPGIEDIRAAVLKMDDNSLKSALLSALSTAGDDMDALRKSVAGWFDDSMERLSGAYKRHLKVISIVVGVIVAVLLNADSFGVAHKLWFDPDLRVQLAKTAADTVKQLPSTKETTDEDKLRGAVDRLRPLPIGWTCRDEDRLLYCMASSISTVTLSQILGWLLTAAALSLGAPFWFDILSKLVNIRGTGPKPERADSQSKK